MNILRGAVRWLLAVAIGLMLASWVTISVLQATVLNRDTVKTWFATTGLYDKALRSLLPIENSQGLATSQDMQRALDATFPPDYVKQQTEHALDAFYNWLEAKEPMVAFSIPVQEKRAEFEANLAKEITPRLASLPACPTRISPDLLQPTCIPAGTTAADFIAQSVRLDPSDPFLKNPINQDWPQAANTQLPDMSYLPAAASALRAATYILPVLAVLCAAAYVLLTDDKIRGLGAIGRRVMFQGIIIVIGGIFLWVVGAGIDLGASTQTTDSQQLAIASNLLNPLVHTVLPDAGRLFMLYGGIIVGAGVAAWVASIFITRKYARVTQFAPSVPPRPQGTAQQNMPAKHDDSPTPPAAIQ